jgi:hypothetical protein
MHEMCPIMVGDTARTIRSCLREEAFRESIVVTDLMFSWATEAGLVRVNSTWMNLRDRALLEAM